MATAANDDDIEFPHKSEILAQRATHPCTCLKPSRISVCLISGSPTTKFDGISGLDRHTAIRRIEGSISRLAPRDSGLRFRGNNKKLLTENSPGRSKAKIQANKRSRVFPAFTHCVRQKSTEALFNYKS